MSVPDYQSFLLPLLEFLHDGSKHSIREAYETLATRLNLTEEDLNELLPSGQQTKYENRVGWAAQHLKKASLIDKPARGTLQITERGVEVLAQKLSSLDSKFLQQYPEYLIFIGRSPRTNQPSNNDVGQASISQTPEEILQESYQALQAELAEELLHKLKSSSPAFFERVVVDLLVGMGYGGSRKEAGKAIGRSGDGGIDGIISEDPLGLDNIYIQAKRWEGTVGRPVIQAFAGSLEGFRARKGVVITTSGFSKEAKEYVTLIEKKIILINGEMLVDLMIDNNIGVDEKERFVLKKIDSDYFEDDA
ncbi:restriction endonuclease [filamentous cyanobacterium LEGE 11480]|uniref:Restriction endonuclease n=1 Tax=Romeriopsis navalis LEGE 11480 TaxID=2777977 RepID=A0A928VRN5_9CYAN|nr:restriction endonuclease [Romeriopsis navalis]MBE9030864.1 restriction endonuclease [Romeriopsis navalis LEGE 11480]